MYITRAFKNLFQLEDKIMRLPGVYLMWSILYISNLTALLVDDTQGSSRDFNIWVNALSVIYGGFSSLNNIFGSAKSKPSSTTVRGDEGSWVSRVGLPPRFAPFSINKIIDPHVLLNDCC